MYAVELKVIDEKKLFGDDTSLDDAMFLTEVVEGVDQSLDSLSSYEWLVENLEKLLCYLGEDKENILDRLKKIEIKELKNNVRIKHIYSIIIDRKLDDPKEYLRHIQYLRGKVEPLSATLEDIGCDSARLSAIEKEYKEKIKQ